jgi:hypothetical protein
MTPTGMAKAAAATAMLSTPTAAVAMKTLALTAMVGAQTTINNQLKTAMVLVTELTMMTATMMTIKTKAAAVATAATTAVEKCGGSAGAHYSYSNLAGRVPLLIFIEEQYPSCQYIISR